MARPVPVYTSVTGRAWRRLDMEAFRARLSASPLCHPHTWNDLTVDELAEVYDSEITAIADDLVPVRTVRRQSRPSDPWFDDECRNQKRLARFLERRSRRATERLAAGAPDTTEDDATAARRTWQTQLRAYRTLRRLKRETFWTTKVQSESSAPRQLWKAVDSLLGRGRVPGTTSIAAGDFHRFFDDKVAGVRASTDGAAPAQFSAVPNGHTMTCFEPVSADDVTAAVRLLPDKQCLSDPVPTRVLKSCVDLLAPFLSTLFSRSLACGSVPRQFKKAYVTPLMKKADLDPTDVKSYRPISNLSVLSKLLERLVARRLVGYLDNAGLMPVLQSAYRANHSTETAVLKVTADLLRMIDEGDVAVLALLDLSAAFDTVDHEILLRRLHESYGIADKVLAWFASYLSDRTQHVRYASKSSEPTAVLYGVPQGSVLGPLLFLLYTADLLTLVKECGLLIHMYADDDQLYGSCRPEDVDKLTTLLLSCVAKISDWMRSNRLQFNAAKTEVMWCASLRRKGQLPTSVLQIGASSVTPCESVRDLGIHLDADMSMRTHINKTVSSCFASMRQIRSIRRSVSRPVLRTLVSALVLTRMDYGCATLAGLPASSLDRLQSVLNAAARLVLSARKYDHVTPLLRELHWLRVPERITFKLAVLVYRCLHGQAPRYLAEELRPLTDIPSRRRLRSASSPALAVPSTRRRTIGDRESPVAAARAWNGLPTKVTTAPEATLSHSASFNGIVQKRC